MSIHLSRFPICRHTKTDGHRCKSPALAASAFCYHHRKLHRSRPTIIDARPALTSQPLPALNDRQSIQRALNLVLNGLAMGQLDNRTAGQMLYLIQLASSDLKKAAFYSIT